MEIWILGNRGANVPVPNAIKSTLEQEPNIHVLDCQFSRYKGLTGTQWAEMWLKKRNNRPAKVLTLLQKPASREVRTSQKKIRKELLIQRNRKKSAKNPFFQLY